MRVREKSIVMVFLFLMTAVVVRAVEGGNLIVRPRFCNAKVVRQTVRNIEVEKPRIQQVFHRQMYAEFEPLRSIKHEADRPRVSVNSKNDTVYRTGTYNLNRRYATVY